MKSTRMLLAAIAAAALSACAQTGDLVGPDPKGAYPRAITEAPAKPLYDGGGGYIGSGG